jgi:hypothetical protein
MREPSRNESSAKIMDRESAEVAVPGARTVEISRGAFPPVNGGGVTTSCGFAKYWFSQSGPLSRLTPILFT